MGIRLQELSFCNQKQLEENNADAANTRHVEQDIFI
jgi:hypothetical protein